MMVSTVKVIVMTVVIIAMLAPVSVVKGMIIASVVLMPMSWIIIAPAGQGIVLIMTVMMWKIGSTLTIAIIIMIRPFAIIISVHNGISAAISIITRIIRILPWIMDTSAGQQSKTEKQHFFGDRIHSYSSVTVNPC